MLLDRIGNEDCRRRRGRSVECFARHQPLLLVLDNYATSKVFLGRDHRRDRNLCQTKWLVGDQHLTFILEALAAGHPISRIAEYCRGHTIQR